MPPSPIPAPLPPWARALLQLLPGIAAGLQEVLQYIGTMQDVNSTQNSQWRHIQVVWEKTGSTESADRAVTSFDIANITNGAIDNSWTDADYTSVQSDIASLVTAWSSRMQNGYRALEARYYLRGFNPMTEDKPFVRSGPPERIFPLTSTGSGVGLQARQVAFTTTERTPYARHWGRNYWPFPTSSLIDASGLIPTASVDSWGLAVHDQYANLMGKEFFPVVPVTQVDKVPVRGLLTVTELQMDNVPDVVRRRRPKNKTHAYVSPVVTGE